MCRLDNAANGNVQWSWVCPEAAGSLGRCSRGVILPIEEYRKLMEELESIRAYDAAKSSGDEAIPFDQAVRELERDRR